MRRLTLVIALAGTSLLVAAPGTDTVAPRRLPTNLPVPMQIFDPASYWNTPFPADAPVDPRSATYIKDSQRSSHTQNYLRLTGAPGTSQDYATPIYWARSTDPVYTITTGQGDETVDVRIPRGATSATGSDGQMTIIDPAADQVVGLRNASYRRNGDRWKATSVDRYVLSSNGLSDKVTGRDESLNFGHRGIPASVRAVRVDEVRAGRIDHRLACFWWATADAHHWPMSAHETGKGGVVPEGIVVRIKPSVDLDSRALAAGARVIANALKEFGCLVGDNSGSGNRLKLERDEAAWRELGVSHDALSSLPWSDWEFVRGGYRPGP